MLCKLCDNKFEPKTNCQIFCSIDCQETYSKKKAIEEKRAGITKICTYCDKEYEAYFYNSDKQKFCSANCRHRSSKSPAKNKRQKKYTKNCGYCEKQFDTASHNARFCSTNCRMEHHKEQWRLQTQRVREQVELTCPICEARFNPKNTLKQIYCSKRCREKVSKKMYKMLSTCYQSTNIEAKMDQLGYSPKDLLEHLQTFPDWDKLKKGDWHLDHKFPIIAFVREGITNPAIICHLSNLQPLSGRENCKKNDTYTIRDFKKWVSCLNKI